MAKRQVIQAIPAAMVIFQQGDALPDFKAGCVLLVDKPLDWTSFDVVNKIRYRLKPVYGKIKVGHAGTLDPRATGLLIICTGKMTKQIDHFQGQSKHYFTTVKLGCTTPSFDTETEEEHHQIIDYIDLEQIESALKSFKGDILQKPPIFSALKKDGKKAYDLARKGIEVKMQPRPVTIHAIEEVQYTSPILEFNCHCSKGTYIRSLANDIGETLNVGGYLHALRRTQIGDFKVDDAWQLEDLIEVLNEVQ